MLKAAAPPARDSAPSRSMMFVGVAGDMRSVSRHCAISSGVVAGVNVCARRRASAVFANVVKFEMLT